MITVSTCCIGGPGGEAHHHLCPSAKDEPERVPGCGEVWCWDCTDPQCKCDCHDDRVVCKVCGEYEHKCHPDCRGDDDMKVERTADCQKYEHHTQCSCYAARIAALEAEIMKWQERVAKLKDELRDAHAQMGYGDDGDGL